MSDDNYSNDDENSIADPAQILSQLNALRAEHRHLDTEVAALQQMGVQDMLKLGRMKKRKLRLKDRIRALEDQITPDILA